VKVSSYGFLFLLTALPLAACTSGLGAIDGVVIDLATREPIAGAIVVAKWQYVVGSIAGGSTHCDHADSAVTDDYGRYHIDPWHYRTSFWAQLSEPHFVSLSTYKPGMFAARDGFRRLKDSDAIIEMSKWTATHAQQMERLSRVSYAEEFQCGYSSEWEDALRPAKEMLIAEAKAIATDSAEDQKVLQDIEAGQRPSADQPAPAIKVIIGTPPNTPQASK
jgi:hypothetical protein